MNHRNRFLSGILSLALLVSCSSQGSANGADNGTTGQSVATSHTLPQFNADSAYQYTADQCSFGPRVPGSEAQLRCAQWLESQLIRHGAEVKVQRGEAIAYDGTKLPVHNVFGSFNPDAKMRVLLLSHWDSRPFCDEDADPTRRQQPVMGANDGASGVGVLLELARLASQQKPQVGIDLLLCDAEDYGAPDDWKGSHDDKWWALGTQLWCKEAARQGYRAQYGILLDMVGSPDATFYREFYSNRYASTIVNEIWSTAARLGYSQRFIDQDGGGVTDDHVFVNRMLNIPTVDIIDYRISADGTGFCPEWHTADDTMEHISRQTLGQVGDVLVHLLW